MNQPSFRSHFYLYVSREGIVDSWLMVRCWQIRGVPFVRVRRSDFIFDRHGNFRREAPPGPVVVSADGTVWWRWRDPIDIPVRSDLACYAIVPLGLGFFRATKDGKPLHEDRTPRGTHYGDCQLAIALDYYATALEVAA